MAIVGARSIAEAVAAAAEAELVSAWANREAASDGDRMVLTSTGASFVYSSTVGDWVRPWVYAGTPILRARIDGDQRPDSESPAWTITGSTLTGDASITSDGASVTFDGGTSNSNYAFADIATGGSDHQDHFMTGRFESVSFSDSSNFGSFSRVLYIFTGSTASSPVAAVTLRQYTAGDVSMLNWTPAEIGTQYSTEVATTECYLEIYVYGDAVWMYHDHAAQPMSTAPLSLFPQDNRGPMYRIGDAATGGRAASTVRELLAGEF